MTSTHIFPLKTLMAIIVCFSASGLQAQTTVEVSYYKPLEAAGGGLASENVAYMLRCDSRHSLFVFVAADAVLSVDELAWDKYDMNVWLGEEEHWLYKDLTGRSLTEFVTTIQENRYLVEDTVHPMTWEILSETKYIAGMLVKKARCEHRGRAYTAWFAPGIPLSNGPWKLGGLPGLILEAYDDEKEVVFLFKSIRQMNGPAIVKPDSRARSVTMRTYLEESEKEMRQYMEFMEARMKAAGADVDVEFDTKYTFWEYIK
ncbi:MAG: GLPGLI family protein [Saprospiraceae bacterium]|nr:GLPGLI family protein [Lewinella sp.]